MRKQQLRMECGGDVACDKNAGDAVDRMVENVIVDGVTTPPVSTAKNSGVEGVSLKLWAAFSQCFLHNAGDAGLQSLVSRSMALTVSTSPLDALNCSGQA